MKKTAFWICFLLAMAHNLGAQTLATAGDYSPAVIAREFNATYGVRADVVMAVLDVYARKGLSGAERKQKTEALLQEYSSISKPKGVLQLSETAKGQLGISTESALIGALNWDLFAKHHYLSTSGAYSPAVIAKGDVNIWFGIPEGALRTLAGRLEANRVELVEYEIRLKQQAIKYEKLKRDLECFDTEDPRIRKAKSFLKEGDLEEAERLLLTVYRRNKKVDAEVAFMIGNLKELALQYDSAATLYREAVLWDAVNPKYRMALGSVESTLAHYEDANKNYKLALGVLATLPVVDDTLRANLFSCIGDVWFAKGNFDSAETYYSNAMAIDCVKLGKSHPNFARDNRNVGESMQANGYFKEAAIHFSIALEIDTLEFGDDDPRVVEDFNSLGTVLLATGDRKRSVEYQEKALGISQSFYGHLHPKTANCYRLLGDAWLSFLEFEKSIQYLEASLGIDSTLFGLQHPRVADGFNRIGFAYWLKGDYNQSIRFQKEALAIDTVIFGGVHPRVAQEWLSIGDNWSYKNDHRMAIHYYEKSLEVAKAVSGEQSVLYALALTCLGRAWVFEKEYDKAIAYCEAAYRIDSTISGLNNESVSRDLRNLGLAWFNLKDYEKALQFYDRSLRIDTLQFGINHVNVALTMGEIGSVNYKMGNYETAVSINQRAVDFLIIHYSVDNLYTHRHLHKLIAAELAYAKFLERESKYDIAISIYEKAMQNAMMLHDGSLLMMIQAGIGYTYKKMGQFEPALHQFELSIIMGDSLIGKHQLENANVERASDNEKLESMDDFGPEYLKMHQWRIRVQQYICLKALGRRKEANCLAKLLLTQNKVTSDEKFVSALRKSGLLKDKKTSSANHYDPTYPTTKNHSSE